MSEQQNHNLSHILKQLKENKKYDTVQPIKEDFHSYSTFSAVKKIEQKKSNSLFTTIKNFIFKTQ
tara:strand:+ start:117 stop:311 length:195 start_codon:yes stop_codon:yes gene_type:complete